MKELMPKVKGKADGKEVNQILAGMMEINTDSRIKIAARGCRTKRHPLAFLLIISFFLLIFVICFPLMINRLKCIYRTIDSKEDLNSAELHSLQYFPTYGLFYLHNTGVSLCQSS